MKKPQKKRGPPPFKPTAKQRKLVERYAAGGMSEPGIARQIGICQNTLRKHFSEELTAAFENELARNLDRLVKAADAGNVTAMKHLDTKITLAKAEHGFKPAAPAPEAPEKQPKLGKKEEADIAAQTAGVGTSWGSDLSPPGSPKH